ncbi:hypothetical protein M413DRAFT_424302 [Hebeloma cylindrosporum]|uniref:Uncharacterized protein n=1 Tax=Hebeloma cylindrosporum TaxID=76867 RepID=A0A0C3BYY2_HEBCY|nr:hypothetical protein M413DRAFT_424302 [Hebeloma cylindrosporum h7]
MFEKSFLATSWLMAQVKWVVMQFRKLLYQFIRLEARQPRFVETSHRFSSILTIWGKASWTDFDLSWLSFRDSMFLNITDDRLLEQYFGFPKPNYDAVKGIRSIARGNQTNTSERYLFAQFHCLHDISSSIVGRYASRVLTDTYRDGYFQLLLTIKTSQDFDQRATFLSHMLAISHCNPEENILAILDIVDPSHILSPTLSRHFAECSLRLLTAAFTEVRQLHRKSEYQRLTVSPFSLSHAIDNIKESEDESETEFMRQWALSIKTFFLAIINSSPDGPPLEQSFHAHIFFRWYFHDFMEQMYSTADSDNLDSEILAVIVSVIIEISVALHDSLDPKRDFLFYTASYYDKLFATGNLRSKHPNMIVSAVSTLLEALGDYKARLGDGDHSLEKILEIPSFSDKEWWDFLKIPGKKPTYGSSSGEMVISVEGVES